ncbi:uncharacterized protein EI90DRAFT_3121187 [Cantharellus anzutake]|uniref:uncharacterized protein n=1 Tax=Cantharellus anzutake TaxID=1750568 RepID=UPI001902C8CB|nr:uncharacterized protein EI90DRAFT_3121187 [Cantharellus anzutake]KAF8334736.1 hypothetical protein EI90DRAFT_3121187 [Cantharellus anzutake]
MSLRRKANVLKQKVDEILAAGGDVAVPILNAVNAASDAFPPLKSASSGALFIFDEFKKFKQSKQEWEDFGEYVNTMTDAIEAINDTSSDEAAPWMESITKLNGALQRIQNEIKLHEGPRRSFSFSNFVSLPRDLDGLKKDLKEALELFQVSTIGSNQGRLARVENASVLGGLRLPSVAHHDSAQTCLEGTRIKLMERIMAWCHNTKDSERRVMLLTAVAGAGKTSVAHSISEKCMEEGILVLSFFFRAGEQSQPDCLFSGAARSLARHDPVCRTSIVSTLQNNPALTTAPFTMQFEKLVAEPLHLKVLPSDRPMVIIIDALDECESRSFELLADILRERVPKLPSNIKFFVTSRQFDRVERFLPLKSPIDRVSIDLLDDTNVQDCDTYIRMQLNKLKHVHPSLNDELKEEEMLVQGILKRAGGLFIWISTIFHYMRMTSGAPMRTLERLLDTGAKTQAEEMMDSLYMNILEKWDWKDGDFVHDYPVVMGAILFAQQPLSVKAWDAILSPVLKSSIYSTLAQLAPLLSGYGESHTQIRILHQSFRDFVTERINPQSPIPHHFAVDARRANATIAMRCVDILNKALPFIKGLGTLEDLSREGELQSPQEILPEEFRYACRHIVYHLNQVEEPPKELVGSVRAFLNKELMRWVEVCVRTEGYISITSFPEWAKLKMDHSSGKIIHALVKVLRNVWENLAFFSRFPEAYKLAKDSVVLCRCLVSVDSESYTPDLALSLGRLYASLFYLGEHLESLPTIEESVKLLRQLVNVHSTLYTPGLAQSLGNLCASLCCLERHPEALLAIEESVKLWRELVAVDPASYTSNLAQSLQNLKVSLDKLGKHSEALEVIRESVKLWRGLVVTHPTSYTPDLARSLQKLSVSLNRVGDHSETLPVIEESVELWRQLAASHPTSYTPDLARSLQNLHVSLDKRGRHFEGLLVVEESVGLWRHLVAVHPTSYTPDLAGSLENLNESLGKLGRHSEALSVITESVQLWRQLVALHPRSYTPDLAESLENLNGSLSNLGQHSDALPVIEESVNLWRRLVSFHPASYTPSLARSLQSFNTSLTNLGRHSDALPVIEESVGLWRQLDPTSYTSDLAKSLENLNESLSNLGRHSDAFPVIEESVNLWRQLVSTYPESYTPSLARSLRNLNTSLSNLGRHSVALLAIEESVELWRQQVAVHLTSYSPGLALSLKNLNESLSNLGRHSDALPVIGESVNLWRHLVAIYPASYTPSLARSLQNLGMTLSNLQRHSAALPVIEESVKLWRQLVAAYPALHTPGLAISLCSLSSSLHNLGRHKEALPLIEESVSLWRPLLDNHPTSYASDVALALHTLSTEYSCLGDHSAARDVGEESSARYYRLYSQYPDVYGHRLWLAYSSVAGAWEGLGRQDMVMTVSALMRNLSRPHLYTCSSQSSAQQARI